MERRAKENIGSLTSSHVCSRTVGVGVTFATFVTGTTVPDHTHSADQCRSTVGFLVQGGFKK